MPIIEGWNEKDTIPSHSSHVTEGWDSTPTLQITEGWEEKPPSVFKQAAIETIKEATQKRIKTIGDYSKKAGQIIAKHAPDEFGLASMATSPTEAEFLTTPEARKTQQALATETPSPLPIETYAAMRLIKKGGFPIPIINLVGKFIPKEIIEVYNVDSVKGEVSPIGTDIAGMINTYAGAGEAAKHVLTAGGLGISKLAKHSPYLAKTLAAFELYKNVNPVVKIVGTSVEPVRAVKFMAERGTTFAIASLAKEASEVITDKEQLQLRKRSQRFMLNTALGTSLGGIHALQNVPTKAILASIDVTGWKFLNDRLERGYWIPTKEDIPEYLANAGIRLFIETFGGKQLQESWKRTDMENYLRGRQAHIFKQSFKNPSFRSALVVEQAFLKKDLWGIPPSLQRPAYMMALKEMPTEIIARDEKSINLVLDRVLNSAVKNKIPIDKAVELALKGLPPLSMEQTEKNIEANTKKIEQKMEQLTPEEELDPNLYDQAISAAKKLPAKAPQDKVRPWSAEKLDPTKITPEAGLLKTIKPEQIATEALRESLVKPIELIKVIKEILKKKINTPEYLDPHKKEKLNKIIKAGYKGIDPLLTDIERLDPHLKDLALKKIQRPKDIVEDIDLTEAEKVDPRLIGIDYKPITYPMKASSLPKVPKSMEEIEPLPRAGDPLNQIKDRMITAQTKKTKAPLPWITKINDNLFDDLGFIENDLEKETGTQWTSKSPSLRARAYRQVDSIITSNITKKGAFWTFDNEGSPVKALNYGVKDLLDLMKQNKSEESFSAYLLNRRSHFDYMQADELRASGDIEGAKRIEEILKKNKFNRQKIHEAHETYKNSFIEEEKMYDAFTKVHLELLHSPYVQIINDKQYQDYLKNNWYAPYFRKELASALEERQGSEKDIINPVEGLIKNHQDIMRKSLKQATYNAFLNIVEKNPDLFEIVPYGEHIKETKNIIIAKKNYENVAIKVHPAIKKLINEALTSHDLHKIEKLTSIFARMFIHGTTVLPPWFAIKNFPMDQFVLSAQTFNKTKPLIDPLKLLYKTVFKHDSLDVDFFKEYLLWGGEKQTLQGMFGDAALISQEKGFIKKSLAVLDRGLEIGSIPNTYSELISRGAEYVNARKAGKHPIVALEEAGRATAPFHHRPRAGGGTAGRSLMSATPYLRSTLQAFKEHIRTVKDPRRQKQLAFTMATVTTLMVGSLIYLLQKGSEDQKILYKGLDARQLGQNIYYPLPDGKRLGKIPVREQLSVLGTVINMLIADIMLNANYTTRDYVDGITSFVPESINVLDPVRLMLSWIPQIIGPAFESIFGKKTWPKVREIEAGLKHLPPGERAYRHTAPFYKWLGKEFGISPVKADHLVEGYLGRIVRPLVGKDIGNPYIQEMYFAGLRPLQNYYEKRNKYRQLSTAYNKQLILTTEEEYLKTKEMLEQIAEIDKLLREYKSIDIAKNENYAAELRMLIIHEIDALDD